MLRSFFERKVSISEGNPCKCIQHGQASSLSVIVLSKFFPSKFPLYFSNGQNGVKTSDRFFQMFMSSVCHKTKNNSSRGQNGVRARLWPKKNFYPQNSKKKFTLVIFPYTPSMVVFQANFSKSIGKERKPNFGCPLN